MNEAFAPPLVKPVRGGARGSGAVLTEQGHKVLDSFRRLENMSKTRGRDELLVIGRAASHAVARQE
jgi:molybdate transport repressor ModE-like protein